jgi:hypothetical protein
MTAVSEWGAATYGEPCRECGYSWSGDLMTCVGTVETCVRQLATSLYGANGSARIPDLGWSVVGYLSHVADNLRIWSERLVAVAKGADQTVSSYDETQLALVRRYNELPIEGALWSLERAAADWTAAVETAQLAGVALVHPERGQQSLLDVVRSVTHDVVHHRWDIARILPEIKWS